MKNMNREVVFLLVMTLFSPTTQDAGRSDVRCRAVVAGLDLVCTCSNAQGTLATDVTWTIDGTATTTGLSGPRNSRWTKASSTTADNGKKVTCTIASSESAAVSTIVEAVAAPEIACTPAPNQVGVQTTCTCTKKTQFAAAGYIFKIAGTAQAQSASNTVAHKVEAGDRGNTITCKVVYSAIVMSTDAATPVTMNFVLLAPTLTSNAVTAVPISSVVFFICVKNVNFQWDPTSYKFFDQNGEIRNGVAYNMLTFKVTKADDGRRIWCQYFNTATAKIDSNTITLKVNISTVGTTKPTVGTTKPTESKTTDDHKIVVAGFVGPMIVLIIGITVAIILWIRVKRAMKDIKDGNRSRQPQPNVNGTPAGNSDTGQEYINVAFEDGTNITRPNDPHDYENIEGSRQRAGNLGPRATNESVTSDQVYMYAELGPVSQSEYLDIRQAPV